ncbi:exodeoxyribonuclease V subunit beta [Paracoccus sp. SCSIO 75233]|uniref:UvrD-helicase domain-containing protein n=1 Tax=Paracoccus sp. SCSIO 75233 TaxID=3017782 RepID=UPI0022F039A1|nr:UvrD-helicase domain-containing protein [Paracoccus sp. SCSIO 75233]WBU54428.1 UvrD-helicase domain-containing protein [Paracoccus sp. SCSIO 75233]
MDKGLVIVPAGAGAGKTHRIKTQLADWVSRGTVRPERILAVTFTEAAAGELRERIRAALLADDLVNEAMAVERAYVSTIHSLGLRLLTEHAFAAGSSPQPRHLGDAERDVLIRQALAHARALDPIKADPGRFGYNANVVTGETAEAALRTRVIGLIDLLRGLGDSGLDPGLIPPAEAQLDAVYGTVLKNAAAARRALVKAISKMLSEFPDGGMGTVTAKGPCEALEKDLALFRQIDMKPKLLDSDWAAWQALRRLFVSNLRTKTPAGYDDLAKRIMKAADVLPSHPGPLADAKLHLSCLIACAQEVMTAYEARKKALGLIDFADMITGAERLLREKAVVRSAVLDEIDCVIIDEFQDTNPVQFALLWQLASRAPRCLLVGDIKQSIMGFQGADPRLSQALAKANPAAVQPLDRNWRSTPAVMQFVNALGKGLFGKGYHALEPTRDDVVGAALEILYTTKSRGVRTASKPQEHVAERIARILIDEEVITDRYSGASRPARPSDIALLVCRHTTAARYAEELRWRNVPVRISDDGWLNSPAILTARAALAYAANPSDIHSALLLRTLGPDPLGLNEALAAQMEGSLAGDKVLVRLAALSDRLPGMPVSAALDLVLDAAGLRLWADRQPDTAQERADLLRLEAEAEDFENAHRDLKAASGFHGNTAKVFLGWLEARLVERDFDRHPDPSGNSAEAVEIVTWHASKGREWPITVVAEFDHGIEERPGTTSVRFDALDQGFDMEKALASAALIHTPEMVAPEAQARFIADRRSDFEANARNLLYVALTRARDRLILEWPAFLKQRTDERPEASKLFHVFEDTCQPNLADGLLQLSGVDCPAVIWAAPEWAEFSEYVAESNTAKPRFGHVDPMPAIALSPWRPRPSQAARATPVPMSRTVVIGTPWPTAQGGAARGTALHLALRCHLIRPDLAPALGNATGLDDATLERVAERAAALKSWLSVEGYNELYSEIQVLGRSAQGAEIAGSIDLFAIGPEGYLLIDHKSSGTGVGLGTHWPQLSAYAGLARELRPELPLMGLGLFWLDHGLLEIIDDLPKELVR